MTANSQKEIDRAHNLLGVLEDTYGLPMTFGEVDAAQFELRMLGGGARFRLFPNVRALRKYVQGLVAMLDDAATIRAMRVRAKVGK